LALVVEKTVSGGTIGNGTKGSIFVEYGEDGYADGWTGKCVGTDGINHRLAAWSVCMRERKRRYAALVSCTGGFSYTDRSDGGNRDRHRDFESGWVELRGPLYPDRDLRNRRHSHGGTGPKQYAG